MGTMFGKRRKRSMDPNAAHLIGFALDVGRDEIASLIEIADERGLVSQSEHLFRHRDALRQIHADFLGESTDLQDLADRADAIAVDIENIEQMLELGENDQSLHCALASSGLSAQAKIARGEIGTN